MIERCQNYRRVCKFRGWDVVISDRVFYLMEIKGGKDLGVWSFMPLADVGLMVHAFMGPECRGRDAVESAKDAFSWIFQNTECRKIYADIPNTARAAQFLAAWSGMRYITSDNDCRGYMMERAHG